MASSFSSFWSGGRELASETEIVNRIIEYKNFKSADISTATCLLFFATQLQRTWLVATSERLYCFLDDVRKPKPLLQWVLEKETLSNPSGLNIVVLPESRSPEAGLLNIEDKKNWLYSKELYPKETELEHKVRTLISNM